MSKTYACIDINGKEENLPKEDGDYITHDKITDIVRLYSYRKPFKNEYKVSGGNKPIWIETIDWYLIADKEPIESETDAYYNRDKLFERKAELKVNDFIKEIKDEFPDQNWDYLEFIKDRLITQQPDKPSAKNQQIVDEALDLASKRSGKVSSSRHQENDKKEVQIQREAFNEMGEVYTDPIDKPSDGKSEDELDLIQYVTNLLYDALEKGFKLRHYANIGGDSIRNADTSEFDQWVEIQTENLKAYYNQFKK